ncbi:MAG TPA: hypothetical protein VK153_02420 [Candidatus Paceibacterota bacterium]|nr:hypothetical protein [Candidatus Paceibacterota bacterium]
MLATIIIFSIAILSLFGMMLFRAWEIRKIKDENSLPNRKIIPEVYFRHVEKIMLYLTKYVIQSIVLVVVKYWFIAYTKTSKWISENWPKVHNFFQKKPEDNTIPRKNSFVQRAILESKIKIKRMKEKVLREHGEN